MLGVAQAQQRGAEERTVRQVEGPARLLLREPEDLGLPLGLGQ